MKSLITSLVFLLLLAGCSTFPHHIRHGKVFDTDATVRLASYVDVSPGGYDARTRSIRPNTIVCPEPSPDVAKAIQLALSASANMGNGKSSEVGMAYAESLMQLGKRIATVQLLRDELSDLCRNYANGAISGATYTIRLSRLDKKMVTLLSSEAAAGALADSARALTGSSSLSKKGNAAEIDAAQKAVKTASDALQLAVENAKKSATEANMGAVSQAATALNTANDQLAKAIANNGLALRAEGQAPASFASGVSMTINTETIEEIQENFIRADDSSTIIDACLTSMAENHFDENSLDQKSVQSALESECPKQKDKFTEFFKQASTEKLSFPVSYVFDKMLAETDVEHRDEVAHCAQKVRLNLWKKYGYPSAMSNYCQQVALPKMFALMEKQAENKVSIKLGKRQNQQPAQPNNTSKPIPSTLALKDLNGKGKKLTITLATDNTYTVQVINSKKTYEIRWFDVATTDKEFDLGSCTPGIHYQVNVYHQNQTGKGKKLLVTQQVPCEE